MIGPMDQLVADMAYVVHTLKAHYPIPMPEDQVESWDPPYEATTSYVLVEASQQDAQLTHVIELLQKSTKDINNRLKNFHFGMLDTLCQNDTSFKDASIKIEVTVSKLRSLMLNSPLYTQSSTSQPPFTPPTE